jgi:hypothetical protein
MLSEAVVKLHQSSSQAARAGGPGTSNRGHVDALKTRAVKRLNNSREESGTQKRRQRGHSGKREQKHRVRGTWRSRLYRRDTIDEPF